MNHSLEKGHGKIEKKLFHILENTAAHLKMMALSQLCKLCLLIQNTSEHLSTLHRAYNHMNGEPANQSEHCQLANTMHLHLFFCFVLGTGSHYEDHAGLEPRDQVLRLKAGTTTPGLGSSFSIQNLCSVALRKQRVEGLRHAY